MEGCYGVFGWVFNRETLPAIRFALESLDTKAEQECKKKTDLRRSTSLAGPLSCLIRTVFEDPCLADARIAMPAVSCTGYLLAPTQRSGKGFRSS